MTFGCLFYRSHKKERVLCLDFSTNLVSGVWVTGGAPPVLEQDWMGDTMEEHPDYSGPPSILVIITKDDGSGGVPH